MTSARNLGLDRLKDATKGWDKMVVTWPSGRGQGPREGPGHPQAERGARAEAARKIREAGARAATERREAEAAAAAPTGEAGAPAAPTGNGGAAPATDAAASPEPPADERRAAGAGKTDT